MPTLEVQLRTEEGDLLYARTIAEAMKMAKENMNIWKISWTDCITDERIRLVRAGHAWVYEPITLPEIPV
jgi:hypothetical protein